MKKLIIFPITLVTLMSFSGYVLHENYKLRQVYENLEDMKSFINEDVFNGSMDPEIGEIYLELINDSENKLEDVINNK